MIDLTTIPQETIIARGQYSTINAEHKDAKKRMAILCGLATSIPGQVLRHVQPDGDVVPDMNAVRGLICELRTLIDKISACADDIELLAMQRATLKSAAWGR